MQKEHLKRLVSYANNQSKTPGFTRGRLFEKVKLFFIQRKTGGFHKDFYIQQIEKLAYHRSCYKILGKRHVADVRQKAFECTPGNISNRSDYAKRFSFEPDGQLHNIVLTKIIPYPWKVAVLIASIKQSM